MPLSFVTGTCETTFSFLLLCVCIYVQLLKLTFRVFLPHIVTKCVFKNVLDMPQNVLKVNDL